METVLTWIGIASVALLLVAVGVAWWEYRKRLARLREELLASEHSRLELEDRVRRADERLSAMNQTVEVQKRALAATRERAERAQAGAARPGQATGAGPGETNGWLETEPMVQAHEESASPAGRRESDPHRR